MLDVLNVRTGVNFVAALVHTSPNTNVLNIQRWAIEDLNVLPYPETRVYKEIAKDVCARSQFPATSC
jgi:hypothetical protein